MTKETAIEKLVRNRVKIDEEKKIILVGKKQVFGLKIISAVECLINFHGFKKITE